MSRYKMLPLESPFIYEKDWWEDCVVEKDRITPIFNRNGLFLDRYSNYTWIEINGEAWSYSSPAHFMFSLKQMEIENHRRMTPAQFEALKTLIAARIINWRSHSDLYDKYYQEYCYRQIHQTYISSRLDSRKMLANIRQEPA